MRTKEQILEELDEIYSLNEIKATQFETRISVSPSSGITVTHNLNPDPFGKFAEDEFDTEKHLNKFFSKEQGKENTRKIKPVIKSLESKLLKELEKAQKIYASEYKRLISKYSKEFDTELNKLEK